MSLQRFIAAVAAACVLLLTAADRRVAARAAASSQAQSGSSLIPWHTRLEDARAAALETNQPMLLEFWAGWCAPCKVMDAEVYSTERVASAMKKAIPVRIDMDAEGVLARKYGVETIPTLLYTDSHGNELFRYTGVLDADLMVELLTQLPADMSRVNRLAEALTKNKNDVAALEGLGRELREASLYRASNHYYDRALRAAGDRQPPGVRAGMLIATGRNHLLLKEYGEARERFERCLRDFKGAPSEADALLGIGEALLGLNKPADARRVLQTLAARHPSSPAAAEAGRLLQRR